MNHKRNHNARRGAGFSLMEIIAALAILGGAAFVLLNAHFTALRLHEITEDEVNFRQLLEITVAKAEVGVYSGILSDGGDFGARYPDYSWSYEAVEAGSDPLILLYAINASVQGPDEQRELTFYVYDTGLGDQTEKDGKGGKKGAAGSGSGSGSGGSGSGSGSGGVSGRTGRDTSTNAGSRRSNRRGSDLFGNSGGSGFGSGRRSSGGRRRGGSNMFGN